MENLLLPRRERLFNNGGKLHFQNFSALFQGVLSTSFPSGKYHCKQNHCRRQYHASGISLSKATRFPFREIPSTLHFWNRIVGGGNTHSFACVRLFLHASTEVSCVGFIIWFPSGGLPRYARNDIVLRTQNNICSNYSRLKRREFDEIVFFSVGFENYSVLGVHEFSSSAEKAKYRELSPFYKKNFGRARVCSPRRLPEIISKCYDCGNAACW